MARKNSEPSEEARVVAFFSSAPLSVAETVWKIVDSVMAARLRMTEPPVEEKPRKARRSRKAAESPEKMRIESSGAVGSLEPQTQPLFPVDGAADLPSDSAAPVIQW